MMSKRRYTRANLLVPVLLALTNSVQAAQAPLGPDSPYPNSQQSLPQLPNQGSSTVASKPTKPGALATSPSTAPKAVANPPAKGQAPLPLPSIGQVASPYQSKGPASLNTTLKNPKIAPEPVQRVSYNKRDETKETPTAPVPSAAPSPFPTIAQVESPYSSQGPANLTETLGSPQMSSSQLPGGSMGTTSPYESTANPGTYANNTLPPSAFQSGQGVDPAQPAPGNSGNGPAGALSSGLGGFPGSANTYFSMIGDASPPIGMALPAASHTIPNPPTPGARSISPSVRGFKFSENQSPMPQDRVYFSMNYYNNVNSALDKFFNTSVRGINIYRYIFGFEKTFNQGMGSIGIRLPIDNVFARPVTKNAGIAAGDSTALGNFTIYFKHILAFDSKTGSLASAGVAITPGVAPDRFAGAKYLSPNNTTSIQPYFAFLLRRNRLYFQGFIALDVPTNYAQPTLLYNDYGIGYMVYVDETSRNFITAIAPTLEVHINTPVNHTNAFSYTDIFGTPDIVNITTGLNTRFRQNSVLTMGVITPVTGPRPFTVEATVLFNYYFGRSVPRPAPPNIGG
jgi:hypothetical protein